MGFRLLVEVSTYKMEKKQFLALLDKQSAGLTTQKEEELIAEIYDILQERKLDWELAPWEEEQLKLKIKDKIEHRISVKSADGFIFPAYLKWAASVTIIFILGFLFFMNEAPEKTIVWVEKSTNDQQKATITLTDGSSILLNTNSRILYPEQFSEEKRQVILEGEAFFEVTNNESQPFEVVSRGVVTQVLGTSFNINAQRGSDVEVAVLSGLVGVSREIDEQEKFAIVKPNQIARVLSGGDEITIEPVDINHRLAWKSESISFDLVPFEEVVDRLSRLYNLTIDIKGDPVGTWLIRATYSNKSLYTVLYGLKNLVDFKSVKISDRHMVIEYIGCK